MWRNSFQRIVSICGVGATISRNLENFVGKYLLLLKRREGPTVCHRFQFIHCSRTNCKSGNSPITYLSRIGNHDEQDQYLFVTLKSVFGNTFKSSSIMMMMMMMIEDDFDKALSNLTP